MRHALVVDDMEERHQTFTRIFADPKWGITDYVVHHAYTVAEAQAIMREAFNPPIKVRKGPDGRHIIEEPTGFDWSIIFLDHDCDDADGPDFIHLARWIVDNPHVVERPPVFFVHSHNPDGANNLKDTLAAGGYTVVVKPFKTYP